MKQKKINKLYTLHSVVDGQINIIEMPITKVTERTIHCYKTIFNKKTLICTKNERRAFTTADELYKTVRKLIENDKNQQDETNAE